MDSGSCDILRRQRRLRHYGWRVWIRQPIQPRIRYKHRSAEYCTLQQRPELRLLLRDPVHRREAVVPPRLNSGYRHQFLPAEQRPPQQQRRLVQPSPPPLRPLSARIPTHCSVQGRNRPRFLPEGGLQQEGRHKVHHQRPLLLQPRAHHQRRRRRRRPLRLHQRLQNRMAADVEKLGAKLAEQLLPQRPEPLLQGHHQRRPHRRLQQRGSGELVVRSNLRRRSVLMRKLPKVLFFFKKKNN